MQTLFINIRKVKKNINALVQSIERCLHLIYAKIDFQLVKFI